MFSRRSRPESEKFTLSDDESYVFNDSHATTFSNLSELCFQSSTQRILTSKKISLRFSFPASSWHKRDDWWVERVLHHDFQLLNNSNRHPLAMIFHPSHSASVFMFSVTSGLKSRKTCWLKIIFFASVRRRKISDPKEFSPARQKSCSSTLANL